jgi:hypothetical protein
MVAGIVFAAWVVNGEGEGAAQAGVVDDLVLSPGTPTDLLYPGGDPASVAVTVHNPNTYLVSITSFYQTPGEAITSSNVECTPDVHGVTFTTANGVWELEPGATVDVVLANSVSMSADSAKACQGSTFTIPLTVSANSGTAVVDADGDGVPVPEDCDDSDPSVYPGATEIAGDGIDQDCDGVTDEGDFDGDGFSADDCDDSDPSVHPGATEIAGDGIDQDCDGVTDEGDVDGDGDGFIAGDCDPNDATVFPGATEIAHDGIDQNCNGHDLGDPTLYLDLDGDGYGDFNSSPIDGEGAIPPGFTIDGTDCDDSDPGVHPGATEIAGDGIDNDCDAAIDESFG